MPDGTYSLSDLCGLADVTPRTVRYYIAQGLLRSPGTSGPGARYDDGHLARLRLIRRLQREHLPLAEIRARLAALTDDEAIAKAEGPAEPPADSALDYVRGILGAGQVRGPTAPAHPAAPAHPTAPSRPAASSPAPAAPLPAAPLARGLPGSIRALRVGVAGEARPRRAQGDDAADLVAASPEPTVAERSQWERYVLAPDVELHVRRPLTRSQNRGVARLLEAARLLLEEDQP